MQCLKCGREIPAGQVFCRDCLADMEKYPVKPGTAVQLPKRPDAPAAKKQQARRPALPPEEQVKRLKRRLWIVSSVLAVLLALAGLVAYLAVDYIWENEGKPLPGQNYSAVTEAATESTGE